MQKTATFSCNSHNSAYTIPLLSNLTSNAIVEIAFELILHTEEKQVDFFRLKLPSYFRYFTYFPCLEEKIPSFDCKPILDAY